MTWIEVDDVVMAQLKRLVQITNQRLSFSEIINYALNSLDSLMMIINQMIETKV